MRHFSGLPSAGEKRSCQQRAVPYAGEHTDMTVAGGPDSLRGMSYKRPRSPPDIRVLGVDLTGTPAGRTRRTHHLVAAAHQANRRNPSSLLFGRRRVPERRLNAPSASSIMLAVSRSKTGVMLEAERRHEAAGFSTLRVYIALPKPLSCAPAGGVKPASRQPWATGPLGNSV